MSSVDQTAGAVKWFYVVHRRGKARIKRTVKVALHRPVQLPEGGEDLVRCGTALVEVTGVRTQWVAEVKKRVGRSLFTYHVTQPYTDRAACELAAENSIKAGQHFEEVVYANASPEERTRWLLAACGRGRR